MDPHVIQLPWILRRLIVSLFVLPLRPKSSAEAYQSIWWQEGSPLIVLSQRLLEAVRGQTSLPVAMAIQAGGASGTGYIVTASAAATNRSMWVSVDEQIATTSTSSDPSADTLSSAVAFTR